MNLSEMVLHIRIICLQPLATMYCVTRGIKKGLLLLKPFNFMVVILLPLRGSIAESVLFLLHRRETNCLADC
jgi:choline-glycine betaine transporter